MSSVVEGYMAAKSLAETDDAYRNLPLAFLTTHVKCGGQITPETASAKWTIPHHGNKIERTDRLIEIGRCDRCGLAGIVCEPPR